MTGGMLYTGSQAMKIEGLALWAMLDAFAEAVMFFTMLCTALCAPSGPHYSF